MLFHQQRPSSLPWSDRSSSSSSSSEIGKLHGLACEDDEEEDELNDEDELGEAKKELCNADARTGLYDTYADNERC